MPSTRGGPRFFSIAAVTLAAALLAGCGSGYSSGGSSSAAVKTVAGAAGGGRSSAHRLTATETEYKIALSASSVPAGTYTVDAVNSGRIVHALELNGPGVTGKQTGTISPGDSRPLVVKLEKGTYDVFCPLPGHKALGMDAKLTVT